MHQIYNTSLSLLTDLYQITMAYGYWKMGMAERKAVFHLFFRKHPFKGQYTIACGLQYVIGFLQNFHFTKSDIAYLKTLKGNNGQALFDSDFLSYLQQLKFTCDVTAIPEGTVVFPHEPLLRIEGPLLQGQLVETILLNMLNFQTLIATKAARICKAAQNDAVLEFGLRRAQGIDGGISASRAAYIGGCIATSNVLAGKLWDIPVKGTHAHSWVMCFDTELQAFEAYAQAMPNNCVFLVDTYDTVEGVKKAIKVGEDLRKKGYEMLGIRLDSGDLGALSIKARELLDAADFADAAIVASNDLDEYKIEQLKKEGAKITVWGVGTKLATAYDQPALGGVYKLGAIQTENGKWQPKIKRSEQVIKTSNPGILQVNRFYNSDNQAVADQLINELGDTASKQLVAFSENAPQALAENLTASPLLVPIFEQGKLVYNSPNIHEIRTKTQQQMAYFSQQKNYLVGLEKGLYDLKKQLLNQS